MSAGKMDSLLPRPGAVLARVSAPSPALWAPGWEIPMPQSIALQAAGFPGLPDPETLLEGRTQPPRVPGISCFWGGARQLSVNKGKSRAGSSGGGRGAGRAHSAQSKCGQGQEALVGQEGLWGHQVLPPPGSDSRSGSPVPPDTALGQWGQH